MDSITIKEGGASRAFGPVSRLRVLKQGIGTEDFVPESGTTLTTKSITENGTYPATQDNAYGYSQVSVNCSQEADSITGKKQDGNEYTVSRDGDGNIQEDKVPSALLIALAPLKNAYNDGETIDLTGIVAVAVDGNDQPWTGGGRYPDGIIPASELVLPVNTAHYDSSHGDYYLAKSDSYPNGLECFTQLNYLGGSGYTPEVISYYVSTGQGYVTGFKGSYAGYLLAASADSGAKVRDGNYDYALNETVSIDGKRAYYSYGVNYNMVGDPTPHCETNAFGAGNKGVAAWTMVYGEKVLLPIQQDVVVQWRRPGDGKTLSDEFAILVSKTT